MKTLFTTLLFLLFVPASQAAVRLAPIYANEASNWPLETFAANGLFRQIADYQQGHPQAIVLDGGEYTLPELAQQVSRRAISRTASGWTLHYPLVIGPGTRLSLSGHTLFIEGRHGGCLINRGELVIERSTVSSNGNRDSGFIHGWGGSSTEIRHSNLSDLGRADYRANGVSVARHRYQGPGAPAILKVEHSRFDNLYRGVDAEAGSRVSLSAVTINNSREQGLVLDNSPAQLEQLHVTHSASHGLRAEGRARFSLSDSELAQNGGSGVLLENHRGEIQMLRVRSLNNREYGAQIKSLRDQENTQLESLTLSGNGSDGLRLDGSMQLTLKNAEISHNLRYAISVQAAEGRQISGDLLALQLHQNRLAALHTAGDGHLVLQNLSLRHSSNRGKYLAGNLADKEADLLPLLLKGQQVTVPFTEMAPTIPLASLR